MRTNHYRAIWVSLSLLVIVSGCTQSPSNSPAGNAPVVITPTIERAPIIASPQPSKEVSPPSPTLPPPTPTLKVDSYLASCEKAIDARIDVLKWKYPGVQFDRQRPTGFEDSSKIGPFVKQWSASLGFIIGAGTNSWLSLVSNGKYGGLGGDASATDFQKAFAEKNEFGLIAYLTPVRISRNSPSEGLGSEVHVVACDSKGNLLRSGLDSL